MDCSQVREQLHPFADDELSPEEMEAVQAALAECGDCQIELDELRATTLFAREAFTGPVRDVDLSGVYDGVMARIAQEDAAAAPASTGEAEPGWLQKFTRWLGDILRFEHPMQSLGAMAALALIIGASAYLSDSDGATRGPASPAPVAKKGGDDAQQKKAPRRRAMESEQEMARSKGAVVESYEVAEGELVIEGGQADSPVVVWHVNTTDEAPTSPSKPQR